MIVGSRRIDDVRYCSAGSRAWKALIVDHVTHNALMRLDVAGVQAYMQKVEIPGTLYEEVSKRGNN